MVSPTSRRDRAQLLLIAAIAIAFIILGIAVALNTVLYTQTISSSNTVETAGNAEQVELEVKRGVQAVVQEANRNGDDADDAVEEYVPVYQNQSALSRPSLISVDNISVVEDGTQITNTGPVSNSEEVYNHTPAIQVGQFIVDLDLTSPSGTFDINFGSESVTIDHSGSDITITSGPLSCSVSPADDDFTIDLMTGEATGTHDDRPDCRRLFSSIRGEYDEIEFGTHDGAVEGYDAVVDAHISGPGTNSVPWSLTLDLAYDSKELSVDRTIEVNVYGDRL